MRAILSLAAILLPWLSYGQLLVLPSPPATSLVVFGPQTSAAAPAANDPVFNSVTHVWHLGEASGNARADSVGSISLNETGGTVASAAGIHGNAANFNAVGHFLDTSVLNAFPAQFVSLWVNIRTLPAAGKIYRIYSESQANGGALFCWIDESGNVGFSDTGKDNDDPNITQSLGSLNAWHLVVFGCNGADTQYLSVGGATFSTDSGQAGNMALFLALGPTNTDATVPDGLMDEVYVFGTVLSQGDVTTLLTKFYSP